MNYSRLTSKTLAAFSIATSVLYYSCSVNGSGVNEESSEKQENPKWLRATWNVDSSIVNYDDGQIERRKMKTIWAIGDTLIRIEESSVVPGGAKIDRTFPYIATDSHIDLKVPAMYSDIPSIEMWNIEIIDSGKMKLTHHDPGIEQILYMSK